MNANMGHIDRGLRVIAALVLAYLWWTGVIAGTAGTAVVAVAVIFLLTSLIGFCPLYRLVGLSTRGADR